MEEEVLDVRIILRPCISENRALRLCRMNWLKHSWECQQGINTDLLSSFLPFLFAEAIPYAQSRSPLPLSLECKSHHPNDRERLSLGSDS